MSLRKAIIAALKEHGPLSIKGLLEHVGFLITPEHASHAHRLRLVIARRYNEKRHGRPCVRRPTRTPEPHEVVQRGKKWLISRSIVDLRIVGFVVNVASGKNAIYQWTGKEPVRPALPRARTAHPLAI